jgi:2'-5' RNA ligase superfamily
MGRVPERRQSAVVVPVPAAEPVVRGWRQRYDASARLGMPAHVTLLYPFLSAERLTAAALARLRGLCAERPAIDSEFIGTGRFPGVLYLAPDPPEPYRELTEAITATWPEAPPYGGAFDSVIPHLTVADGAAESRLAVIERDLARQLPVSAHLSEARLFVFDGTRWRVQARLPFGGG